MAGLERAPRYSSVGSTADGNCDGFVTKIVHIHLPSSQLVRIVSGQAVNPDLLAHQAHASRSGFGPADMEEMCSLFTSKECT